MHWITIILIGIASNLDNLGIGLAYGMKRTKIPLVSNLTIAIMSMIATYIAVRAGSMILTYISTELASLLGSLLLCAIGLWTLLSNTLSRKKILENPENFDMDQNHIISFREAIPLGCILCLNCLAGGIAIGANGISAIWTVLSIGFFSVLSIGIGSHFGILLTKTFIGKYSTAISGWLILLIGIFEMFA